MFAGAGVVVYFGQIYVAEGELLPASYAPPYRLETHKLHKNQ